MSREFKSIAFANRWKLGKIIFPLAAIVVIQGVVIGWLLMRHQDPASTSHADDIAQEQFWKKIEGRFPVVVATLSFKSKLPRPWRTNYPNCILMCKLGLERPEYPSRPDEVVAGFMGLANHEYQKVDRVREGSRILAELVPFHEIGEQFQTMARANDITEFNLPKFFVRQFCTLSRDATIEPTYNQFFRKLQDHQASMVRAPPIEFTPSQEAVSSRILKAKEDITAQLDANGGTWQAWDEKLSSRREAIFEKVCASGGFLHEKGSYFFRDLLNNEYRKAAQYPEKSKCVRLFVELHRQLKENGIHLIVVPFPAREEINCPLVFPEFFSSTDVCEPWRQKILLELLERGVDVIDVVPALRQHLVDSGQIAFDNPDHHPTGLAVRVTAEEIASILRSYGAKPNSHQLSIEAVRKGSIDIKGSPHFQGSPFDAYSVNGVSTLPLAQEILIVGDSYSTFPEAFGLPNTALPDHLAYLLGRNPRSLAFPSAIPSVFSELKRSGPRVFEGTSVVILIFGHTVITSPRQYETPPGSFEWAVLPLEFPGKHEAPDLSKKYYLPDPGPE